MDLLLNFKPLLIITPSLRTGTPEDFLTEPIKRYDLEIKPDLEPTVGALLAALEDATNEWREGLEEFNLTEEAICWQAYPDGHSIGGLLLHLADAETYWFYEVAAGNQRTKEEYAAVLSQETNQYGFSWPVPPARPLSWYFELLDATRARTREIVAAINDPLAIGTNRNREFTLRWILNHVISHEAYHGGQAVLIAVLQSRPTTNDQ
jgi:uncharacterized damage-inducible protein DinB